MFKNNSKTLYGAPEWTLILSNNFILSYKNQILSLIIYTFFSFLIILSLNFNRLFRFQNPHDCLDLLCFIKALVTLSKNKIKVTVTLETLAIDSLPNLNLSLIRAKIYSP